MNSHSKIFLLVLILVTIQIGDRQAKAQISSAGDTNIVKLESGKPIEREIRADDVHSYQVALAKRQYLRAVVEQRGIDIVVTVFDPVGRKILEIDSPNGMQGPEPIGFEADTTGLYCIRIEPLDKDASPGNYEARIEKILSTEENAERIAKERDDSESVKKWIGSNAILLRTVEAGNGFEDMQPLKKIIGNARIVSLGEATHGTHEFWQLKHRMLEFLVNEMGFTVFAMEASMTEAFDINEYVLTGKGDPEKALRSMRSWNSEEVLAMIRWMRKYNEDISHLNKVKFYGFHTTGTPLAAKRVFNYLHRVDPEQTSVTEDGIQVLTNPFLMDDLRFHSNSMDNFQFLSNEKKEETLALANSLLEILDDQRVEYIERSNSADWALARQYAIHILQNLKWKTSPNPLRSKLRESFMAENIRWILEQQGPDAKMVVWAHNGHVATISWDSGTTGSMGWHLRKRYGNDMAIFGLAFDEGSFQATDMQTFLIGVGEGSHPFSVPPAPVGTFEAALAGAGLSIAAIDFREIPKDGPVAEWFNSPHRTREIGSLYSYKLANEFFIYEVLTNIYDAILYIDMTTASRRNKGSGIPPTVIFDAPKNLDFEYGGAGDSPPGWILPTGLASTKFQVLTSSHQPRVGNQCVTIKRITEEKYGEIEGSLRQVIDATSYREKKIKLRAWVRVEAGNRYDKAFLWLRVLTQNGDDLTESFYDFMADRPITDKEWREYEIAGEIPANGKIIEYGLAFVGEGAAYLDAISLEAIDK